MSRFKVTTDQNGITVYTDKTLKNANDLEKYTKDIKSFINDLDWDSEKKLYINCKLMCEVGNKNQTYCFGSRLTKDVDLLERIESLIDKINEDVTFKQMQDFRFGIY